MVAYPDDHIIHQFKFSNFTRVPGPSKSPIRGPIKLLAMGADSDGPLLVGWLPPALPGPNFEPMRFSFVSPGSMQALKIGKFATSGFQPIAAVAPGGGSFTIHPFLSGQNGVHARASGDGSVFGLWQGGWGQGFYTMSWRGDELRSFDSPDGYGYLAPGPDGLSVYTATGGHRDPEARPIGGEIKPNSNFLGTPGLSMLTPSADPSLYLGISLPPARLRNEPVRRSHAYVSVHQAGDGRRLLVVAGLDEMDELQVQMVHDELTTEKRFRYIPAAQLLVTIPPSDDRLFLRRLDLEASLGRLGVNYLIGSSPARIEARAGKPLNYRATARSKVGGLTWSLESGPDGLTVASDGRVTWPSPKAAEGGLDVPVVLNVADASGNQSFHRIQIHVR